MLLALISSCDRNEDATKKNENSRMLKSYCMKTFTPYTARADEGEGDEDNDGEEGKAAKAGKGRKKDLPPLARPLICIANDLYAPALRPLREVAEIFQFKVRTTDCDP